MTASANNDLRGRSSLAGSPEGSLAGSPDSSLAGSPDGSLGDSINDPLNDLGGDPNTAAAEARSPPGQWRLLAVALVCWAATSWAIVAPGRAGTIALISASAGCLTLLAWWLTRQSRTTKTSQARAATAVSMLVLLCGCLTLLGVSAHVQETARTAPFFKHAAATGLPATFEARLSGFPKKKPSGFSDRTWVSIEALTPSPSRNGSTSPETGARVPMLLWLSDVETDWKAARWGPGTTLQITAKLKATAAADLSAYTASPSSLRELRSTAVGSSAATFRALLVQHATGIAGAELVPGFAVGDTSLVPETLSELMLTSSLTHLTAVSGSNTGLVIAAMSWCASRLGAGRRVRALAAGAALTMFVLVVGPDASMLRASVMATVLLVGSFGGRRTTALPALGLAILALLAVNPWQALQPGFALSVAATLGILLLAEPTSHWLHKRMRLPRLLALPLAVALAAQLSCGPLLLLLQPGIPAVGVVANLVAAPAAPLGTGLGLIAAVLGPVTPDIATLVIRAASLPASWVAATAEVCASLPAGSWNWPEGWPGALLLLFCQFALLAAWALATGRIGLPFSARVASRQPWQARPKTPLRYRVAVALLTGTSLAVFGSVTLLHPIAQRLATPANWVFVACDVGQGDALLARDPDSPEQVVLIDTGDDPEALERCLTVFGVRRISLLVLTHDDQDHVGALTSVVTRADTALIAPTIADEVTERRPVVRTLTNANVPYRIGEAGSRGEVAPENEAGVTWLALAPPHDAALTDANAASIVLLFEIDGHRVLSLADTGREEQSRMLRYAASPAIATELTDVEVVKVAHHGSRDQDPALYERIGATWGLVSVGSGNRYGHPTSETLGILARTGTRTLRTDTLGSVALVRQPDGSLGAWAERGQ